jgi:hypothetical protein
MSGALRIYDVLRQCRTDALTAAFLARCKDAPDLDGVREAFSAFLNELRQITPQFSDGITIVMAQTERSDLVYAIYAGDPMHHGFELVPWAETLGYLADEESIEKYGREYFAAAVLFEMTYFGFSEEAVRKKRQEWFG